MTKQDVVRQVAAATGIPQRDVALVVDTLMEVIMGAVAVGEPVTLRGFGTFLPRRRRARPARDINRNVTIRLPDRYVPYFKPSPRFVERVSSSLS